jgi:hypothetical protein
MALTLTVNERTELEARLRSRTIRSEAARRARVIVMLANGDSYSTIEATLPCYRDYINRGVVPSAVEIQRRLGDILRDVLY